MKTGGSSDKVKAIGELCAEADASGRTVVVYSCVGVTTEDLSEALSQVARDGWHVVAANSYVNLGIKNYQERFFVLEKEP